MFQISIREAARTNRRKGDCDCNGVVWCAPGGGGGHADVPNVMISMAVLCMWKSNFADHRIGNMDLGVGYCRISL